MSDSSREEKAFDPFEAWRGMRSANLDAWAKAMVQTVNTDAYAEASGVMLESYLVASAPFRELLEKTMAQVLQQLSIPSRADFSSIAQRMTNIEMRLDDLDAKLDGMAQQVNVAPLFDELNGKLDRMGARLDAVSRFDGLAAKLERIEELIAKTAAARPAQAAKPQKLEKAGKAARRDKKESR